MKTFLLTFLVLLWSGFEILDTPHQRRATKWVISENSHLVVNGKTNINSFSCVILRYAKSDTLVISHDKNSNTLLAGAIRIEVKDFDCNNSIMTKELRKTLNEMEFPLLHIRFLSLKEIINSTQKRGKMKGLVEIEIAGTAKRFEITYELDVAKGKITLNGSQAIRFSDFNLQPPKKMGRLVKAKDELRVVFDLKMEQVG